MRFFLLFTLFSITQTVPNSMYFIACEHASLQPIMKCSNLQALLSVSAKQHNLYKNNLTESQDLKGFYRNGIA